MFLFGNLFLALAQITDVVLSVVYWLVLIRALISWVSPDPFNPIVQFLNRTTEPILQPIRRLLPRTGVDISPIVAFLAIVFLKGFLVQTLADIGLRMRG